MAHSVDKAEVEEQFRDFASVAATSQLEEIQRPNQTIVGTREGDYLVIRCRLGAGMPTAFTAVNFGRVGTLAYRKGDDGEFEPLGALDGRPREGAHLSVAVFLATPKTVYTFAVKLPAETSSGNDGLQLRSLTEFQTIVDGMTVDAMRAWPRLPEKTFVTARVTSEKTTEDGICEAYLTVGARSFVARRSAANVTLDAAPAGQPPLELETMTPIRAWGTGQGGNQSGTTLQVKPQKF